jgi:LCP family protein required for cell wall assembly
VTTPTDGPPPGSSGLPPHLDPRGNPRGQRRPTVPRVTEAYREAARGPAPRGSVPPPVGPRPPLGPRSRGKRFTRVLSWIALSMAVLILGLAGVGYLLILHYNGNIQRLHVFGSGTHAAPKAPHNAQNLLIVGVDSRAGANGIGTGGSHFAAGMRSDTIILAHLFGQSDKALFVSFPRDSYVEIPAWTDPTTGTTHRSRHDKINSALAEGGPSLLIATIEKLTDIRVDHYVQVDFVGFKRMVNELGGVDVCLSKSVDDPKSQLVLSAGRHHINGNTALAFVRDRHSFAGQDIDRIKHQQQLIGSLIHKVLSAGTLFNPFKLNGFLDVATSSVKVDENLSINDMKNIALRVRNFNSGGVLFTTIPFTNPGARINGASVVELDPVADDELFGALRRDVAPGSPAPKTAASSLTVKPGNIRVRVYNGSGVRGQGARAFNDLGQLGFATTGIAHNRGTGATQTTIYYGPTKADSARTLAAAIPGSVTQEDPTLTRTLEVVVGSSYNGAKAVTVTGTTPSSGPSPAVKLRTAKDDPCAA